MFGGLCESCDGDFVSTRSRHCFGCFTDIKLSHSHSDLVREVLSLPHVSDDDTQAQWIDSGRTVRGK